jgi:hypothetical protein
MRYTFYSSFVEVQSKIYKKNYALSFNRQYSARKWVILYLEYHSVCPLVRIESAHPHSRKRVCPPCNRGGCNTRLMLRGWVDPIRMTGEKSCFFYLLCCNPVEVQLLQSREKLESFNFLC